MQKKKGISLVVLIVTVLVMIILAGVVIIGLNNGEIINMTNEVGVTAQTKNEKIVLENIISISLKRNIFGSLTAQELQNSIDELSLNMTAMDNGKTIVVRFDDVDKYYEIKPNGKILGTIEIVKDSIPGAFDGSGTQDDPFVIMSIEDLVYFSQNAKKYQNKYVSLGKTLDFKSNLSYGDAYTTDYDVYLGGDGTTGLKEQLTNGLGFKPISFVGTFEGNNNAIKNIIVEVDGNAGLFSSIMGSIVNLKVSGNITSASGHAGGIIGNIEAARYVVTIDNCHFEGNVEVLKAKAAGGIVGHFFLGTCNVLNCSVKGEVKALSKLVGSVAGGLIGHVERESVLQVDSCTNYSNVTASYSGAGGCLGYNWDATVRIKNTCNYGEVRTTGSASHDGIGGFVGRINIPKETVIENCYNKGIITTAEPVKGGFRGAGGFIGNGYATINNSVHYSSIDIEETNQNIGGIIGVANNQTTETIKLNLCYFNSDDVTKGIGRSAVTEEIALGKTTTELQAEEFVNELNNNIESGCPYEVKNDEGTTETVKLDTTGWAKWVYNENSYPTLDLTTTWDGTEWVKTSNN